jgi:integrase/recombinase XerD
MVEVAVAQDHRLDIPGRQLEPPHVLHQPIRGDPGVELQRQLGHANLGITSVYLQGIDNSEIIETVHRRAAPVLPASAGLR